MVSFRFVWRHSWPRELAEPADTKDGRKERGIKDGGEKEGERRKERRKHDEGLLESGGWNTSYWMYLLRRVADVERSLEVTVRVMRRASGRRLVGEK